MSEAVGTEPEGEDEPFLPDVFSPRWHEGYVIGRKGLGSGALEIAEARAAAESGATEAAGRIADVRDGFEVGAEEAALLPHNLTLRLANGSLWPTREGIVFEAPMREFGGGSGTDDGPGFYTGDGVVISLKDLDGVHLAEAVGRVVTADIQAGRVGVYIERVDG